MDIDMNKGYDGILGVVGGASPKTIRRAYRKKALKCHPEMGGTHEKMAAVAEAAEVLLDPEKRAKYDRWHIKPAGQAAGRFVSKTRKTAPAASR